jgi:hypothetical protein
MQRLNKRARKIAPLLLAGLMASSASAATTRPSRDAARDLRGPGSLSNAWADFDKDGDLDLAVSLKGGEVRLYRNDGGVLTNMGARRGPADQRQGSPRPQLGRLQRRRLSGPAGRIERHADRPEPFLHLEERGRQALRRGGGGAVGLTIPNRISRQANWVDYDNDGQVDLYASNRSGPNQLFHNQGGVFTQVFADAGVTDGRPTVGSCWFDYNRDGKLDLFLANQSGATDALWRNDGTGFTDVAPASSSTRLAAQGRGRRGLRHRRLRQ